MLNLSPILSGWLPKLIELGNKLAQVLLFLMMGITTVDVLLRKLTNHSILGAVEITEMMMIGVVFSALARCEFTDGHIRIDFILKNAPPRIRSALDAGTQFLSCILFGAMTWAIFRYARDLRKWHEVTVDLGFPLHLLVFGAGLGCGLLALVLLLKSLVALAYMRKG